MKAGKAYISSLGTTGLLVASSVLLLVVVGALVAFDRWPAESSSGTADAVVVGAAERAVPARKTSAERRRVKRRRAARAEARRARPRTGRADVQAGEGSSALPGDRVVSGLPAPDTRTGGGSATPGDRDGRAAGPAPGGNGAPGVGDGPSGVLGDVVADVNEQAGQAVGEVGETAEGALDVPLDALGPGVAP